MFVSVNGLINGQINNEIHTFKFTYSALQYISVCLILTKSEYITAYYFNNQKHLIENILFSTINYLTVFI